MLKSATKSVKSPFNSVVSPLFLAGIFGIPSTPLLLPPASHTTRIPFNCPYMRPYGIRGPHI